MILNRRFIASITYHDSLNGFWEGRGTGNATLEVKLLYEVTAKTRNLIDEEHRA